MVARAKKLAGLAVLVGVVLLAARSEAMAHGPGYYGGYSGYSSYYGGYGSGCTYGGYYSGTLSYWRPTIVIALPWRPWIGHTARHHHHHHSYGHYRPHGGHYRPHGGHYHR